MIKLIQKLSESGDLKKLFDAGLISSKVFFYRNVYLDYDKRIRTGMKSKAAIQKTADEFDVTDRTIMYAIKIMKE